MNIIKICIIWGRNKICFVHNSITGRIRNCRISRCINSSDIIKPVNTNRSINIRKFIQIFIFVGRRNRIYFCCRDLILIIKQIETINFQEVNVRVQNVFPLNIDVISTRICINAVIFYITVIIIIYCIRMSGKSFNHISSVSLMRN